MSERLRELGIEHLDDDVRGLLGDADVDHLHSVGLAGPWTSHLLRRFLDLGVERTVSKIHELGAAGAWEPQHLEQLLEIGLDRACDLVHERGWEGIDPSDLVSRVSAAVAS